MYIHIDPMHQILQLHHRTALSLASIHFHGDGGIRVSENRTTLLRSVHLLSKSSYFQGFKY